MSQKKDSINWYNNGIFGEAGYACPNLGTRVGTLNAQIARLVNLVGRSLFEIMHHEDVRLRRPISLNSIYRIHSLYKRAGTLIEANSVPHNEKRFEGVHVTPSGQQFVIYPTPYFLVRNPYMQYLAQTGLTLISEMCQHSENTLSNDITQDFGGMVGAYLKRIYTPLATEHFGIKRDVAMADGFILTDEQLSSYDPGKWFTSVELIDTIPSEKYIFTETELAPLSQGIPASALPPMEPWPLLLSEYQTVDLSLNASQLAALAGNGSQSAAGGGATATATQQAASGPVFPPAI